MESPEDAAESEKVKEAWKSAMVLHPGADGSEGEARNVMDMLNMMMVRVCSFPWHACTCTRSHRHGSRALIRCRLTRCLPSWCFVCPCLSSSIWPAQLIRTASKALDYIDCMAPLLTLLLQKLAADHITSVAEAGDAAGGAGGAVGGGAAGAAGSGAAARRGSVGDDAGGGNSGALGGLGSPIPSGPASPNEPKDGQLKKVCAIAAARFAHLPPSPTSFARTAVVCWLVTVRRCFTRACFVSLSLPCPVPVPYAQNRQSALILALKLVGSRVLEPLTWCHQRMTVFTCLIKLLQKAVEPRVLWTCVRLVRRWALSDLPVATPSALSFVGYPRSLTDTALTQKEKMTLISALQSFGVQCFGQPPITISNTRAFALGDAYLPLHRACMTTVLQLYTHGRLRGDGVPAPANDHKLLPSLASPGASASAPAADVDMDGGATAPVPDGTLVLITTSSGKRAPSWLRQHVRRTIISGMLSGDGAVRAICQQLSMVDGDADGPRAGEPELDDEEDDDLSADTRAAALAELAQRRPRNPAYRALERVLCQDWEPVAAVNWLPAAVSLMALEMVNSCTSTADGSMEDVCDGGQPVVSTVQRTRLAPCSPALLARLTDLAVCSPSVNRELWSALVPSAWANITDNQRMTLLPYMASLMSRDNHQYQVCYAALCIASSPC
jgi:hypothetical protein